jgi:hypothetical protein
MGVLAPSITELETHNCKMNKNKGRGILKEIKAYKSHCTVLPVFHE